MPGRLSKKDTLYWTSEMLEANTGRLPSRKMNSFASKALPNGRWYLGIDDEKPEQTKGHYEFPYEDFSKVYRCGVLSAERRAGQYQHCDIENAVAQLHGMLDPRKGAPASKRTRAASPGKVARRARPSAR